MSKQKLPKAVGFPSRIIVPSTHHSLPAQDQPDIQQQDDLFDDQTFGSCDVGLESLLAVIDKEGLPPEVGEFLRAAEQRKPGIWNELGNFAVSYTNQLYHRSLQDRKTQTRSLPPAQEDAAAKTQTCTHPSAPLEEKSPSGSLKNWFDEHVPPLPLNRYLIQLHKCGYVGVSQELDIERFLSVSEEDDEDTGKDAAGQAGASPAEETERHKEVEAEQEPGNVGLPEEKARKRAGKRLLASYAVVATVGLIGLCLLYHISQHADANEVNLVALSLCKEKLRKLVTDSCSKAAKSVMRL